TPQKPQWWTEAKVASTCGCGDSSDSTLELVLNDGHGTADAVGSPFAAKFAQAVRMLAASISWVASRAVAKGAFGWSNRYWISDECVAIGGRSGPAKICGAVSSSNSCANAR